MADTFSQPTALRYAIALLLAATCMGAQAQSNVSDPKALAAVRGAVASQMEADRNDHTNWIYSDHDVVPEHDYIYLCAGSPQGELRRVLKKGDEPVSAQFAADETSRIQQFINSPSEQARAKRAEAHDDQQATELLKMLPDAFIWTVQSETPEYITLDYRPNPSFEGPDMQSRVMSLLAGQLVVVRKGNLIRSFTGHLTEEFKIGFGFIGHLNKGGSIDIERRDVGGGHWEITETHVHIGGHVLFFKSIGTQQDEVKTEWRPSPAKNLQEAAALLNVK